MAEERVIKMGFERAGELEQVKLGDCLWDIHAAGMKLLEFTTGRSYEDFSESELLQSVVRSMLEIVVSRLEDVRRGFPAEFAKLPDAERVIEGVAMAKEEKTWRLVEENVPELVEQARTLLEQWHEA